MFSMLCFCTLFMYLFPFASVMNPLFQHQVSLTMIYWANFTRNPENESQRNQENLQLCLSLSKRTYSLLHLTRAMDLTISLSKKILVLPKVQPWHIKQSAF